MADVAPLELWVLVIWKAINIPLLTELTFQIAAYSGLQMGATFGAADVGCLSLSVYSKIDVRDEF